MKYFAEILKQFTSPQRLLVLILLLSTVILVQYFRTDECSALVRENRLMQEDFVKISQLLREELARDKGIVLDTVQIDLGQQDSTRIIETAPSINEEILKIAESHSK